jgi:hypothetical protein
MTAPSTPSGLRRTLTLALLAFFLGFISVAMGYGQGHFLLSAYHHAGI